jgi:hypothetical protein
MAWLQTDPSGNFHISFRFGGQKFKRSLKTKSEKQARRNKVRLEDTIQLVETGRIEMEPGVDVPTFLLSDGKLKKQHVVNTAKLADISAGFFESLPEDSLEASTVQMMRIHERHLHRLLGKKLVLSQLSFEKLQQYVSKRAQEKGHRGKTVCASTIRKEVISLRSFWNWAVNAGLLSEIELPSKGLRYPKATEPPQFQQLDVVEKLTAELDPDSNEAKEIWARYLEGKKLREIADETGRTLGSVTNTNRRGTKILRERLGEYIE